MTTFILRPAEERDREQIIKIWHEAFGDSAELISSLLDCGLMATAAGAELDGALRAAMFAFDSLWLGGRSFSYLYALCTESAYRARGLGKAVTAYAAEQARARGADGVLLRPGSAGLEKWYASMGARPLARGHMEKLIPYVKPAKKCEEISPLEYLRFRSGAQWELPASLLLAQGCVNRFCGGAFLRCESGIVCAEQSPEGLLIRECISDDPASTLASAAAHFGTDSLLLLRPGGSGLPLMELPPRKNCANYAEAALMPFTLD